MHIVSVYITNESAYKIMRVFTKDEIPKHQANNRIIIGLGT